MHLETDTHIHTIASGHAYSTLAENAAAAATRGLRLIAVTDHGPAMPGSPHIWFFHNMRVIPRLMSGVGLLRGIEANITSFTGELDIDPALHEQLDLVLASFHEPVLTPATRTRHTAAVIEAMASGRIDVFAHGGNPSFPIEVDEVAKAAAACNVLVEINNSSFTTSRPGSAKNCAALAEAVARHNARLTFGSDAHIACNVGRFEECIALVERIGFPSELLISNDWRKLLAFLRQKQKKNVEDLAAALS